MKFFLPLATSEKQAERVYARITNHVKEIGYEVTPHRIASVMYRRGDKLVNAIVGASSDNDEIILAIFKNDVGYFVCTYSQGAVWGHPMTILYPSVESAEDFDRADFNETSPE